MKMLAFATVLMATALPLLAGAQSPPAMPPGLLPSSCNTAKGTGPQLEACIVSVTATCAAKTPCHAISLAFEHPFAQTPSCGSGKKGATTAVIESVTPAGVSVAIESQTDLSNAPFMDIVICSAGAPPSPSPTPAKRDRTRLSA